MVLLESKWSKNILMTQAVDTIITPALTVAKTHTKRGYGKLMGIDYTRFEVNDNIIRCSFQQKFAFKTLTMNFVKQIQKVDDMIVIYYNTENSPVDLRGRWIIQDTGKGSKVCLHQHAYIPGWARYLPGVESLINGKIKSIFEQIRKIVI